MRKNRILKLVTVPDQLEVALKGQMADLKKRGFEVFMASSFDKTIPYIIEREQVPHYTIPFERDINILKDLKCLFLTIKLILKVKPDIVHTQSPKAGFIGMIASKLTGVPVRIHTVAGLPLMETIGLKKNILVFIEKLTYWSSTSVLINSKNLYEFIKKNIYPDNFKKLKVLGYGSSNGVDLNYFTNKPEVLEEAKKIKIELNLADNDFVWCFVGRIVKDKGIEELIQCFDEHYEKYNNTKLILLGNFEDKNKVSEFTKNKILINPNIIFLGHKKDIRPYLSLSNAFVFPSYREGLPDSLMQACCFNLPAVATNINGCNEIIINNENGFLVEPKNSKDLLSKMTQIQTNSKIREAFSSKTRLLVSTKFSQETVWQLQFLEYLDLLKKNESYLIITKYK